MDQKKLLTNEADDATLFLKGYQSATNTQESGSSHDSTRLEFTSGERRCGSIFELFELHGSRCVNDPDQNGLSKRGELGCLPVNSLPCEKIYIFDTGREVFQRFPDVLHAYALTQCVQLKGRVQKPKNVLAE